MNSVLVFPGNASQIFSFALRHTEDQLKCELEF
jgi:hypothetical protein